MVSDPLPTPKSAVTATRAESQADRAYLALEEAIVTLQLAPGALVTEAQVTQIARLGRTPVREALLRLAQQGLVRVLPRKGLQITPVDPLDLLGVLDTREVLERLAIGSATVRAGSAERKQILDLAQDMLAAAEADDVIAYLRLDKLEDEAIAAAARNVYAIRALEPLQALMRRAWFALDRDRGVLAAARLHLPIAQAIAVADVDAATSAVDRLMAYFRAGLRERILAGG